MRYYITVQRKMPENLATVTERYEWRRSNPVVKFEKIFAQDRTGFEQAVAFGEEQARLRGDDWEVGVLAFDKPHCSKCEPTTRWAYGFYK